MLPDKIEYVNILILKSITKLANKLSLIMTVQNQKYISGHVK
jgi:hypothetical protein